MRQRVLQGLWKMANMPNFLVGFSLLNVSDSPFALLNAMNSSLETELLSFRSLRMAGFIQASKEQFYLSRQTAMQGVEKYRSLKWNGMPVTGILPALVNMQFRA